MFRSYNALFLDRDGTLIKDCGYLSEPEKVQILPGVKACLHALQQRPWIFFLFSNQSGVGRGLFSLEQVKHCNLRMLELLELEAPFFQETCLAIGTPEAPCPYRKPSPRFILECMKKYHLKKGKCWMVGDKISDVQAGVAADIHTIFLGKINCTEAQYTCSDFFEVQQLLEPLA